jgi:lytic cellulose monooxygenase (C1-hydroxylating)
VDGTKLNDPDIICQRNGTPATTSAEVAAGDMVSLQWTEWPSSHHGPMLDYLAACDDADCSTVDKTQLQFFKIDGVGMISTNGVGAGS